MSKNWMDEIVFKKKKTTTSLVKMFYFIPKKSTIRGNIFSTKILELFKNYLSTSALTKQHKKFEMKVCNANKNWRKWKERAKENEIVRMVARITTTNDLKIQFVAMVKLKKKERVCTHRHIHWLPEECAWILRIQKDKCFNWSEFGSWRFANDEETPECQLSPRFVLNRT